MPLPLILGVLGLGATAVVKHCADEVIDDYEAELDMINHQMKLIQERTNNLIEETMKKFQSTYENLNVQKEQIVRGTLYQVNNSHLE